MGLREKYAKDCFLHSGFQVDAYRAPKTSGECNYGCPFGKTEE